MKDFAQRLFLKQRYKVTWKWPIVPLFSYRYNHCNTLRSR